MFGVPKKNIARVWTTSLLNRLASWGLRQKTARKNVARIECRCGTACSPAVLSGSKNTDWRPPSKQWHTSFLPLQHTSFFPCNAPVFFLCNATRRARPEQEMQPNVNGDNQLGLASMDPGRLRSIAKRCKPLQNHFNFCNRLQWPTGGLCGHARFSYKILRTGSSPLWGKGSRIGMPRIHARSHSGPSVFA